MLIQIQKDMCASFALAEIANLAVVFDMGANYSDFATAFLQIPFSLIKITPSDWLIQHVLSGHLFGIIFSRRAFYLRSK
jgi:hypothetical protein